MIVSADPTYASPHASDVVLCVWNGQQSSTTSVNRLVSTSPGLVRQSPPPHAIAPFPSPFLPARAGHVQSKRSPMAKQPPLLQVKALKATHCQLSDSTHCMLNSEFQTHCLPHMPTHALITAWLFYPQYACRYAPSLKQVV